MFSNIHRLILIDDSCQTLSTRHLGGWAQLCWENVFLISCTTNNHMYTLWIKWMMHTIFWLSLWISVKYGCIQIVPAKQRYAVTSHTKKLRRLCNLEALYMPKVDMPNKLNALNPSLPLVPSRVISCQENNLNCHLTSSAGSPIRHGDFYIFQGRDRYKSHSILNWHEGEGCSNVNLILIEGY